MKINKGTLIYDRLRESYGMIIGERMYMDTNLPLYLVYFPGNQRYYIKKYDLGDRYLLTYEGMEACK